MSCPRCGMAMRDGYRHGSTVRRANLNYLHGIKPGLKAGPIFVCSDGCWKEVNKVECALRCGAFLTQSQQTDRVRFCSKRCASVAARGQPRPRRAGLLAR